MDHNEMQARRRFFHKEQVLIPVSDCYDFVVYPNGLMASFKGQRSAGNEKIILYFLARHMSQETPEGETTEFKDVAQTFWGKHDYIAERTGLTPNRISDAIKSLVECGILKHEVKRGIGQHIAFTDEAISAWVEYSRIQTLSRLDRTSGKRKSAVPVSGSGQFRLTEVGSSGKRKWAVPVSGSGSNIEDKGIGLRKTDPVMDGWKEDQPAIVDECKNIEIILKPDGYKPFDVTQKFVERLTRDYGEKRFREYIDFITRYYVAHKWKRSASWEKILVLTETAWLGHETTADKKTDWQASDRLANEWKRESGSLDTIPY